MNLPNKLTILRVILVPFFILFFYLEAVPGNSLIAFLLFAAASVTDALDGHIARKNNLVTTFGKFLDPLADNHFIGHVFFFPSSRRPSPADGQAE